MAGRDVSHIPFADKYSASSNTRTWFARAVVKG